MVGVLVIAVLASVLIPVAVSQWNGANQTGWTSTEKTLWALGPLFIILGVVLAIILGAVGYAHKSGGGM